MEKVQDKATGENFWIVKLIKVVIIKEVNVRFKMLTIFPLLQDSSRKKKEVGLKILAHK